MLPIEHVSPALRDFCVASESDDLANAATVKLVFRPHDPTLAKFGQAPQGECQARILFSASVMSGICPATL